MNTSNIVKIIEQLETALVANRDQKRSEAVAAYMKHRFSFFGMEAAVRRKIQQPFVLQLKSMENRASRWELIRALWAKDEREFHYFAQDWLNTWPNKWMYEADADKLKWLISQQAWWDSVDTIASNYLGKWAQAFPEKARETFEEWRYEPVFWLNRACLIYQLKFKDAVDIPYLESLIAQLLPNKEFFIQKAIGWSLRQLSKFHPEEVRRILATYPIKGLAYREASKYI